MPIGPKKMPFLNHLAELRQRLLVIAVTIGVASLVCYPFTQGIVNWLFEPVAPYLTGSALFFFGPLVSKGIVGPIVGEVLLAWGFPMWYALLCLAGALPLPITIIGLFT